MNVLKPEKRAEVVKLLGQGLSINQIHARAGVSGFTIAKIKAADPKLAAMPSKRGGAPAHKTAATKARVATPGVAASDSDKLAAKLIGSLEAERDKLVEELRLIPLAARIRGLEQAINAIKEVFDFDKIVREEKEWSEPAKKRGPKPKHLPEPVDPGPPNITPKADPPAPALRAHTASTQSPAKPAKPAAVPRGNPISAPTIKPAPTLKVLGGILFRVGALSMQEIMIRMRLPLSEATALVHEGERAGVIRRRPGAALDGDKFDFCGSAEFIGAVG